MSYDYLGVPRSYKTVTKSDTVNDTAGPFRGVYCTVAGNVVVAFKDGTTQTIALNANQTLQGEIIRVNNTGTTATVLGLV